MITNVIMFEARGQGVSKIALLGRGEEILLTDNTIYNGRLEKKTQIIPRKNTERIKK